YEETALNLLKSATYKFEAVAQQGGNWVYASLGEVTIHQRVTDVQRAALLNGTPLPPPGKNLLLYRHAGKDGVIDTGKLGSFEVDPNFAAYEQKLGSFAKSVARVSPEKKSPRAKEIKKAESEAVKQANTEAAQRTAVEPIDKKKIAQLRAEEQRLKDE